MGRSGLGIGVGGGGLAHADIAISMVMLKMITRSFSDFIMNTVMEV